MDGFNVSPNSSDINKWKCFTPDEIESSDGLTLNPILLNLWTPLVNTIRACLDERGKEGSKVKLAKNILFFCQIYHTLLYSTPPPSSQSKQAISLNSLDSKT